MKRFPWEILLALGAGIAAGLYYAWAISPQRLSIITPDTLRADFKDQFRLAIASAYAATGNLDRARSRMALLRDANPVNELTAQAQRSLAAGEPVAVAQDLARLAFDLNAGASSVALGPASATTNPAQVASGPEATLPLSSPPESSVATPTVSHAATPKSTDTLPLPSTQTPIPTPNAPFLLLSDDPVCNPNLTAGLLQIVVLDKKGQPMPGIEIGLTWSAGEEHFFTGFKPEISPGYADYVMQPETMYSLLVARLGAPVSGLAAPGCTQSGGQNYLGGLKLTFRQP